MDVKSDLKDSDWKRHSRQRGAQTVCSITSADIMKCVCVCFPSGYMLIGNDVKLNSPMSLVGQALAEILQYPERARDALRVLLHLVRHRHTSTVINSVTADMSLHPS